MNYDEEKLEQEQALAQISKDKVGRYLELRRQAEDLYKTFGKIKCPVFKDNYIHFTSEGFNHLVYRIKKQERDKSVQILRFELLSKAKQLVEVSTTIQEYEEYFRQIEVRRYKAKQTINIKVRDVGLFGIIKGFRIKVVIRQVGNGEKKFHSVIPAWSTKYYRDIKLIRNTKGNVADD